MDGYLKLFLFILLSPFIFFGLIIVFILDIFYLSGNFKLFGKG